MVSDVPPLPSSTKSLVATVGPTNALTHLPLPQKHQDEIVSIGLPKKDPPIEIEKKKGNEIVVVVSVKSPHPFVLRDGFIHFIAGGAGGAMAALATCPLEVVKTRLQALHNKESLLSKKYSSGTISALDSIYRSEGIRGLWKGVGANLLGVIPSRAIYFATYDVTKTSLKHFVKMTDGSWLNFWSAISAGMTVTTVMCPLWLIKTRMQLQTSKSEKTGINSNYRNMIDCGIRVVKEEGIRGLYKGLGASYLGITESVLQFVLYERGKTSLLQDKRERNRGENVKIELSIGEYLFVGGIAKFVASVLTYPHEVIRTRIREQRVATIDNPHKYTGIFQAMNLLAKEEGIRGLYGGMSAHLLRVVPNAAILFFTYETVVSLLSNKDEPKT